MPTGDRVGVRYSMDLCCTVSGLSSPYRIVGRTYSAPEGVSAVVHATCRRGVLRSGTGRTEGSYTWCRLWARHGITIVLGNVAMHVLC